MIIWMIIWAIEFSFNAITLTEWYNSHIFSTIYTLANKMYSDFSFTTGGSYPELLFITCVFRVTYRPTSLITHELSYILFASQILWGLGRCYEPSWPWPRPRTHEPNLDWRHSCRGAALVDHVILDHRRRTPHLASSSWDGPTERISIYENLLSRSICFHGLRKLP